MRYVILVFMIVTPAILLAFDAEAYRSENDNALSRLDDKEKLSTITAELTNAIDYYSEGIRDPDRAFVLGYWLFVASSSDVGLANATRLDSLRRQAHGLLKIEKIAGSIEHERLRCLLSVIFRTGRERVGEDRVRRVLAAFPGDTTSVLSCAVLLALTNRGTGGPLEAYRIATRVDVLGGELSDFETLLMTEARAHTLRMLEKGDIELEFNAIRVRNLVANLAESSVRNIDLFRWRLDLHDRWARGYLEVD